MQLTKAALVAAAVAPLAAAQRPSNTSICDYYTTALLKNNTAENQYMLLKLLVNTVAIGNYTQPNHNAVPGILAPGTYNGEAVNLAPYFTGALKSSNRNGQAVSVNFLDGGGATPLMANQLPEASSNQFKLVTHLYQYFGLLLGCSGYGSMSFPAYMGAASQYQVHRFMDLDANQMGYFIQQVGLAATSFGVTTDDAQAVGMTLNNAFNFRCSPPATIVPAQGAQLQSMCSNATCPLAPNSTCSSYPDNGAAPVPAAVSSGAVMSSGAVGPTPTAPSTGRMSSTYTGAAAMKTLANAGAVVGGALAFALL